MYIMLSQVSPDIVNSDYAKASYMFSLPCSTNAIPFLKFLDSIPAKRFFSFYPVIDNLTVILIFFSFKAP